MARNILRTRWWVLSLAAAFASGWVLAPAELTEESDTLNPPSRKTKTSRQRDSLDRSNPSARLVSDLLDEMDAANSPDLVEPAVDRAAAARTAIEAWMDDGRDPQLRREAGIRFVHWLEVDPKAAVTYWNGWDKRQSADVLADVAWNPLCRIDPHELVDWLAENPELGNGLASPTLVRVIAKACADGKNLDLLDHASAEIDPKNARDLLIQTISAWPANHLELIVEYARKNPDLVVCRSLVSRMQPADVVPWVRNEIATHGSIGETLKVSGVLASLIAGAAGTSIKERLALLEEFEADLKEGSFRSGITSSTLVRTDLQNWLLRTDTEAGGLTDWRHRLHFGEISASEVMEEARRALPGAANEQPEEFRNRVFSELVMINPTSAMEILSTLPPPQRERSLIDAGMNLAGRADPQHLLELAETMPPTMATPVNDRFQVWCRAARPSYEKYGESYVEWVAAMSPGIEQDWALSALSIHFKNSDPEKSAHLASLKTLPAGWHPEK